MIPRGIVVHHTAGRPDATVAELDAVHREERRYTQIGYHYVVHLAHGEWAVESGRPAWSRGAHCPGRQDWLGVAVAGDYSTSTLPTAAEHRLVLTLAVLCAEYGLDPRTQVQPHRWVAARRTECPGEGVLVAWQRIIDAVADRLPVAGQ